MAPRARGRAQSARVSESEGCTTQADCRPSVSGQSDARTHIGMASMTPTFVQFRNGAGAACPWPRTLGQGVGEHWRGLQGWLPTFGLRSNRCSHTYWHGVDETDFCPFRNGAGAACPWPRTLYKGEGEQWRGLQGWLPTLGLRLHRCFHTYWHGVDETDFCPFRNGAGAACPWPRTLGQGVG